MKILFITDNFPPELNAPATRTFEHCREWVKLGAQVTVITCFPNFPRGVVFEGYKNRRIQKEEIDGIKVIRVWTYITANEGFFRRTVDYFSFAVSAFFTGIFQKADVIVATSPQFFTTWAAYGLSILKRKPWVFELRDLWPESIKSVGALSDGLLYRLLKKNELFLYGRADHIIPNTDAFKDNLLRKGIPEEKISVIPNGSNLEFISPRPPDVKLRRSLGLQDKFIIGYIGTHGLAHALNFIVRSIANIEDPNIHFLFIGDGAEKKSSVALAKRLKLKNITFLDPVPKEKMPEYISITDVSLAPLKKDETFKTVIPSKIFESAAMGKPILLGVDGQARKVIEEFESGLYFEPENTDDFLEKVREIAGNKPLYKKLSENCGNLAQAYDRKKFARQMLGILKTIAGKA